MPEPSYPGAFGGIDKHDPVYFDKKGVFQPQWMEQLLHISNLTFTGHYLNHSFQGGHRQPKKPLFDRRELWKEVFPLLLAQEWGFWFVCFGIPQTLEVKNDDNEKEWAKLPKALPNGRATKEKRIEAARQRVEAARQMGMRHAQDLRTKFLAPLMPDIQGAIVYVDFEPQWGPGQVLPEYLAYHSGMWEEMRLPGKEGCAVRPGVYGREFQLPDFTAYTVENTDLFLYKVDELDHKTDGGKRKPFVENGTRIYSPMEEHPLRGCIYPEYKELLPKSSDREISNEPGLLEGGMLDRLLGDDDLLKGGLFDEGLLKNSPPKKPEPQSKIHRTSMLIGRQWVFDKGFFPSKKGKTGLQSVAEFDFNAAMVRDLRYPVAMPRIVVLDETRLRTVYEVPEFNPKGAQRVPITYLEQVDTCKPTKLPFGENLDDQIEHEAPLCLLPAAPKEILDKHPPKEGEASRSDFREELYTINKKRQVVVINCLTPGDPATWSTPQPVISNGPVLRRNRAMTMTKSTHDNALETKLFYVSYDLTIIGHRRHDLIPWSGAETLSGEAKVHTFTNITAVSRLKPSKSTSDIVDIFFIDEPGNLRVITSNAKDWPRVSTITTIAPAPSPIRLLTGTSMASISPSPDETLFFGIGLDCHLYMTFQSGSSSWTELTKVDGKGGAHPLKPDDDRLFPHAKRDAYVGLQTQTVYVATLTAINIPCVYVLTKTYKWIMFERRYYPNKSRDKAPVPADSLFEGAPGLPSDYEPKILQDGTTEITESEQEIINGDVRTKEVTRTVKRNTKEGYAFNPFGDIKLSVVKGVLTLWIAAVTMVGTEGKSGDRCALLFVRALVSMEGKGGERWKRIRDFREVGKKPNSNTGDGGDGGIPADLEF